MKLKNREPQNKEFMRDRETEVISKRDIAPAIDFRHSYDQLVGLIREQTLMDKNPDTADLKSISLTRAKAQSFLDAVFNIVQASHLYEIIENDKSKFRRADEMAVMSPILRSLRVAAIAGEKSLTYLTGKLDVALEAMENPVEVTEEDRQLTSKQMQKHLVQTEMIAAIQTAHTAALENINRIVTGLTRVIQLERFSGARPWGNRTQNLSFGGSGGDDGEGGRGEEESAPKDKEERKKRKMSGAELIRVIGKGQTKRKYIELEEDYDVKGEKEEEDTSEDGD